MKIGVSGNRGSFSEGAAQYYCRKAKIKKYKFDYLISVEAVLASVDQGKVDKGIFPIENSNGGIVYEAVYAMSKYKFNIENIFEIDIRHNLLALPGTEKKDIKKIVSHPQALKQCRMYVKRMWPRAELVEWPDTAQAAKDLSQGALPPDAAVIASSKSAEIYQLDILEDNIQDLKFNFTTFVVALK